jgi:hypothetical protein
MKFLTQDIFEVALLEVACLHLRSSQSSATLLQQLEVAYKKDYSGDNLWPQQLISLIDPVVVLAHELEPFFEVALFSFASKVRKQLDENLEPVSTLGKVFGGTLFTRSHPAPSERPRIAYVNTERLLNFCVNSPDYCRSVAEIKRVRSKLKIREWHFTRVGLSHKKRVVFAGRESCRNSQTQSVGLKVHGWSKHDNEERVAFVALDDIDFSWRDELQVFLGCPYCGGVSSHWLKDKGRKFTCQECRYSFVSYSLD